MLLSFSCEGPGVCCDSGISHCSRIHNLIATEATDKVVAVADLLVIKLVPMTCIVVDTATNTYTHTHEKEREREEERKTETIERKKMVTISNGIKKGTDTQQAIIPFF